MNTLQYVINYVKQRIPKDILYEALMYNETQQGSVITTVEDKLLRKVIRPIVLLDANVIGGVEVYIPLANLPPSYSEYYYTVYQIPAELTMNREIVSVLNLTATSMTGYFGATGNFSASMGWANGINNFNASATYNPVLSAAGRIGDSASSTGAMIDTVMEVLPNNTVVVYAHYRTIMDYSIRAILENDNNLNNIQPRNYGALGTLCELAAKMYIYNTLIIPINSGRLVGGQDLGIFKSIVESYSDAAEAYRTYLREVWGRVSLMNDAQSYSRFLGSMIQPDL